MLASDDEFNDGPGTAQTPTHATAASTACHTTATTNTATNAAARRTATNNTAGEESREGGSSEDGSDDDGDDEGLIDSDEDASDEDEDDEVAINCDAVVAGIGGVVEDPAVCMVSNALHNLQQSQSTAAGRGGQGSAGQMRHLIVGPGAQIAAARLAAGCSGKPSMLVVACDNPDAPTAANVQAASLNSFTALYTDDSTHTLAAVLDKAAGLLMSDGQLCVAFNAHRVASSGEVLQSLNRGGVWEQLRMKWFNKQDGTVGGTYKHSCLFLSARRTQASCLLTQCLYHSCRNC